MGVWIHHDVRLGALHVKHLEQKFVLSYYGRYLS